MENKKKKTKNPIHEELSTYHKFEPLKLDMTLLLVFVIGVAVKVVEVPEDLFPQIEPLVGVDTPILHVFEEIGPVVTKDGELFKKLVLVGVIEAPINGDPLLLLLLLVDKNKFGGDGFLLAFGGNKIGELLFEPTELSNNLVVKPVAAAAPAAAPEDWDEAEVCLPPPPPPFPPYWLLVGEGIELVLLLYNIKLVFKSMLPVVFKGWLRELNMEELVIDLSIGTSPKTWGGVGRAKTWGDWEL